jgi:hypothetical protein
MHPDLPPPVDTPYMPMPAPHSIWPFVMDLTVPVAAVAPARHPDVNAEPPVTTGVALPLSLNLRKNACLPLAYSGQPRGASA